MIVKTVVLPCNRESAFRLFTERAGEWWPAGRRHTKDAASTICMEPSGRFYERSTDGREVELGVVREWVGDERLVLDWFPGTSVSDPTRVEVTFAPVNEGTKVTVVHTEGAAGMARFSEHASAYDASWTLVLDNFAKYLERSS